MYTTKVLSIDEVPGTNLETRRTWSQQLSIKLPASRRSLKCQNDGSGVQTGVTTGVIIGAMLKRVPQTQ